MSVIRYFIGLILLVLLVSCMNENPNLVNPPPQYQTVSVRFVNFAGDFYDRNLSMDGILSGVTAYAACTDTLNPPADSCYLIIKKGEANEFRLTKKAKFTNNTFYSIFALPSRDLDTTKRPVDTVVYSATLAASKVIGNIATVKFFNAVPNYTTMSVSLGCPNGTKLVSSLAYRSVSSPIELIAGTVAISLVRNTSDSTYTTELYKLDLSAQGQYMFISYRKTDGTNSVILLNEFNGTSQALTPLSVANEKDASVRAVNFSSTAISLCKSSEDVISSNVQSKFIDNYVTISACTSATLDSMLIKASGTTTSMCATSLEVFQKFSVFVFDSADESASLSVVVPPVKTTEIWSSRAMVRVINAAPSFKKLVVSVGARTSSNSTNGYSSGQHLANPATYGVLTDTVFIQQPGLMPITIFTANVPKKLLYCTLTEMSAGKNYILVITEKKVNDEPVLQMALVEESDGAKNINYLAQGSLSQMINITAGNQNTSVSMPPALSDANVYFAGSIATVSPVGDLSAIIHNKTVNYQSAEGIRNLIVACGTESSPLVMTFRYSPIPVTANYYNRRFINLSSDISSLEIAAKAEDNIVYSSVAFGETTPVESIFKDQKQSVYFINPATKKTLLRIDDISFIKGTTYTIIFAGDANSGYSAVIQNEL